MVTSKNEFAYFQKTAFYYLLVQYSTYEMKGVRMQDRLVNFSFESLSFHVISTTTTYHSLHLRSSGRAVSPLLSPYSASKVEASPAITSFPILMFIFSGPGKGERRNAIKSHGERGLFFLTHVDTLGGRCAAFEGGMAPKRWIHKGGSEERRKIRARQKGLMFVMVSFPRKDTAS